MAMSRMNKGSQSPQEPAPKPPVAPESKDRPVKTIRIRNIRANIWANRTQMGTMFNVTVDRIWKEDDHLSEDGGQVLRAGEWQQSSSFGKDDLLLLAKVVDQAHTWIYKTIQDSNEASF